MLAIRLFLSKLQLCRPKDKYFGLMQSEPTSDNTLSPGLRGGTVRISLKNTFLVFEETGEDAGNTELKQPSPRSQASPRSRSLECPSSPNRVPEEVGTVQLESLNRILDQEVARLRDSPRSGSRSGSPYVGPRSPHNGASSSTAGPAFGSLPNIPYLPPSALDSEALQQPHERAQDLGSIDQGPTAQELKQLQKRLEEVCQPQGGLRPMCKASSLPEMPRAWSNNSISTMSTDHYDDSHGLETGAAVEFDLTIEEGPQTQRTSDTLSVRHKGQDPMKSRQVRSWSDSSTLDSPFGPDGPCVVSSRHQRKNSSMSMSSEPPSCSSPGSASPSPAAQRSHSPSMSSTDGQKDRSGQWRPLPKEYRHGHVPKSQNLEEEFKNKSVKGPPTTLMIRNIPNRYTQRELIMELEDMGFGSTFDFLYIPLDKGTMSNVGYAFVNFVDHVWAEKCMIAFQNYRFKRHRKISGKIAAVSVAHIQGLEANLSHYENAAVNTAKLKQRRPVIMANISAALE